MRVDPAALVHSYGLVFLLTADGEEAHAVYDGCVVLIGERSSCGWRLAVAVAVPDDRCRSLFP